MNKEGLKECVGQYYLKLEFANPENETYLVNNSYGYIEDRVVVSKIGKIAIQRDPRLLEMAFADKPGRELLVWDSWTNQWERPGLRSAIYRNRVRSGVLGLVGKEIAIKQVLPDFGVGEIDSTAFEQFTALEAIHSCGFSVVPVLLATERTNRLILEWYSGKHPMADKLQSLFGQYIDLLDNSVRELTKQGRWDPKWGSVDKQPRNYFIGDLNSSDLRQHFVVLDPVSRRSIFIWG